MDVFLKWLLLILSTPLSLGTKLNRKAIWTLFAVGALCYWGCEKTDPAPSATPTPTPPINSTPAPTVMSMVPESGTWSQSIKITGTGFSTTASLNAVYFGSISTQPTSATSTELTVMVPTTLEVISSKVTVLVANQTGVAPNPFVLNPPQLSSASPNAGKSSATILLQGGNFNPSPEKNKVKVGTYEVTVTAATGNELTIKLPSYVGDFDGDVSITLDILGQTATSANPFKLLGPWRQIADAPGILRRDAVSFSIDNYGYVGAGLEDPHAISVPKPFWKYDPSNNTWESIADFSYFGYGTTEPYANLVALVANNKAYVGLGYDLGPQYRMQVYDPMANSWNQSTGIGNNDPTQAVDGSTVFMINNQGYIVSGRKSNTVVSAKVWAFDPSTGQWTGKVDFPGAARWEAAGFVADGKGHVIGGMPCTPCSGFELSDHWEYDTANDSWTQRADHPGQKRRRALGFSIGNIGFLMGGEIGNGTVLKDFWMYDPATVTWTQLHDFPGNAVASATVFVIGQKAYIGTGFDHSGYRSDMWEFDFSKF